MNYDISSLKTEITLTASLFPILKVHKYIFKTEPQRKQFATNKTAKGHYKIAALLPTLIFLYILDSWSKDQI